MRRTTQRIAAAAFFGCTTLTLVPLGCAGIEQAPPRVQYLTDGSQIPAITEDRLAGCVKTYFNQFDSLSYRVQAKVSVDEEGRKGAVVVEGIPDGAPDFAACVRITLREMAVPASSLRLRPGQTVGTTNGQMGLHRNEAGNVIVVGVLVLLGEFVVQYGGHVILFAITLELVDTAAGDIAATLKQEEENKNQCNAELTACLLTPLADLDGNVHGSSRCVMCYDACIDNNGVWPYRMMKGTRWASCEYRKKK